jgi:hypothetical protein
MEVALAWQLPSSEKAYRRTMDGVEEKNYFNLSRTVVNPAF